MKTAFKPGTLVRFNIPNGAIVRIVRYDMEDFYVIIGEDGKHKIAHQDDLMLHNPEEKKE